MTRGCSMELASKPSEELGSCNQSRSATSSRMATAISGKDSSAKEKRRDDFSSVAVLASRSELVVSSKSTVWAFFELFRDGVRELPEVDGRGNAGDVSGPLKVLAFLGLDLRLGDPTSYLGLTPAMLAGRGVLFELARSARSASDWGALEWPMLDDGRTSPSDWP